MNLEQAMEKYGVTPEDIAAAGGVKVPMVKAVLKGRRMFHPKRLPPILSLFKGGLTANDMYNIPKK